MKFPMCTLSNIVSPGMYIVVTTDKEHVAEVKNLEECMTKEMIHVDTSGVQLRVKMCVAVRDLKGKLARGIIENKINNDLYEVLLMDYGHVVEVEKSTILVITNEDFIKVEPLAFIVKLYGLVPARYVSFGDVNGPKACKEWGLESHAFVKNFFKQNHKIVVQSILIQQRIVYGDLFIKDHSKMKYVSLRKLLCKNKFCAYSESAFLRHENVSIPSESVEMETKMEMVKKWQKENFGQFKKTTYQLPSPAVSPKPNISDVTILNLSGSRFSGTDIRKSYKQEKPAEEEKEVPAVAERPSSVGLGRGKFKLMIAEMRIRKQGLAPQADVQASGTSSLQSESLDGVEKETPRTSRGRGHFLRKFLEIRKATSHTLTSHVTNCIAETDSRKGENERFSDASAENIPAGEIDTGSRKPLPVSMVEKAVVKPGEFSEFSDSNGLTEVSLSTEDDVAPPPLVRNSTKKSNLESSELNGGENSCRNEIKKHDEIKKGWEIKEGSCIDKQKVDLECSKLKENETWCGQTNLQVWERPSNLIASNSCWTPFVLFDDSVVESVNTFRELPIQPSIIKNLERKGTFNNLSQVQRWAIPAIRKQHNTLVIGSAKTGKTLSYLVPLIDYVQDEFYFEELPRGNGPSVVILASSASVCESIQYMCHSLLGYLSQKDVSKSKIKVVLAHGGGSEEEVWVTLTNGCDILICTPHCLVRLLEFPILTNFERLSCLVLDEIDIICENPFRKHVRIIFEKAQLSTKGRHYQKIFCGERWTPSVERMVKTYVKSYAMVIGSYLEVVIYRRLTPSIFLVDKSRKAEILIDKLSDKMYGKKVLIFCETTAEAIFVYEFMTEKGISLLVAHENMLADKLKELEKTWRSSMELVLVITDGVLSDMDVREAQVLVHYGLPCKSKTNFFLRYSTVLNSYRQKHNFQKTESQSQANEAHVVILVDDHNHYQLPHIADLVTRLGEKLPQVLLERCEDIRRMIEVGKCDSPICGNLLAFGRCRNSRDCPRRHALVKAYDTPGNLPISGWVNFVVVKTHDASLLSARLLEHIDVDGNSTKFDDYHVDIHVKLAEYFKGEDNRRPLGIPKVGDVCGVRSELLKEEVFYRAKVIEYLKVDKHELPVEVGVKLLDEGDVWKRKNTELYELPKDLAELPPTAVDVRAVGVQPLDFDINWSHVANTFVSDLMTRKLEENQYWSGKVVLALSNTLFLDPIKRKQFLPHLNVHVFDMVVRDELVNSKMAVANVEHLPVLLKLSKDAGIELPKKREIKKEDSAKIQPQWAFFDSDTIEVRFLAAENTSTIFLQVKKYEKLLEELEEDCQKEGTKAVQEVKTAKAKTSNAVFSTLTAGVFCLARFEDGKWNRGRIESENDTDFYVFFVDHGDFLFVPKQDVVPISQALLLRLPCQAIECRLVGIEEEGQCPMEVLHEIYAFSEDGKQELCAYVVSKESEAAITRGRKYDVSLVDRKGVSLNKMLVDCKMVRAKESERCHLAKEFRLWADDADSEGEGEKVEDEQEHINGECSLDSYLNNLTDDVFADENAVEFLKEFASKLFPNLNGFQEIPTSTREEGKEECKKAAPSSPKATTMPEQNIQRLLDLYKKRQSRSKRDFELKSREVLTPQVLWCQTQEEVRLRILLGNVVDYSLECTHSNLSFRCMLGEKFYAVDLKLFGAVNPQMTKVTAEAFHVRVILTKLAYPAWPRLPLDEGKHRWISLDVENLKDKEDEFLDKIMTAKEEIESGMLKQGFRSDRIQPCSDSEDEQSDSSTDGSNDL